MYIIYIMYIFYINVYYLYCFCSQVLHHVVLAFFCLHRSRTLQGGGITAARQYSSKCSTANTERGKTQTQAPTSRCLCFICIILQPNGILSRFHRNNLVLFAIASKTCFAGRQRDDIPSTVYHANQHFKFSDIRYL